MVETPMLAGVQSRQGTERPTTLMNAETAPNGNALIYIQSDIASIRTHPELPPHRSLDTSFPVEIDPETQ